MNIKLLEVGSKINLVQVLEGIVLSKPKQYVSQIQDVNYDEKTLKISMPIENNVIVPLSVGEKYRIIVYTQKGLYQCVSVITDRYKEKSMFMLDVKIISGLEKYQRRQYYRLECDFEIMHRQLTDKEIMLRTVYLNNNFESEQEKKECEELLNRIKKEWLTNEVVDISGGGIGFYTNVRYENGSSVAVEIPILHKIQSKPFEADVNIIRTEKVIDKSNMYKVSAEFIELDSDTREILVRYVFDEQRKRLNR